MTEIRKLTGKQSALVDCLVNTGVTITQAAKTVGMTREGASRALGKDHVAAYHRERMYHALMTGAPRALQRLLGLLESRSEYVQLEASKQVLDRAGFGKPEDKYRYSNGSVNINIDLS